MPTELPLHVPANAPRWQEMDEPGRARYRYLLLVDADGGPTAGVIHGIAELEGGSGFEALHRHNLTQTAHVLSGRGTVTLGERQVAAAPGDTFYIPAGTFHAWEAGAETLRLFWSYPCDRFDEVEYHFADGAR